MKPAAFEYRAPDGLDEALALLGEHGADAKVLAGGQSLVPVLNFRLAQPAFLVDLNGLDELDYITPGADGSVRVGAMTRQSTLERHAEIPRLVPLLAQTMPLIAHPQIRNRGTVGGSLAHADPAGELPVAAVALEADLVLRNRSAERTVAAADFFQGLMTTDLADDEILCELRVPGNPARTGWAFREIARRHGDYAHAGVAARLTLDGGGAIETASLVYLSAGDVPMQAPRACEGLHGERPSDDVFAGAAARALEEIDPSDDIHTSADFKRHLSQVLTRRALAAALVAAQESTAA